MALPLSIQTYHCLCTSLLLSTTHTLSTLPRRKPPTADSPTDGALILPLPSSPPDLSSHLPQIPQDEEAENNTTEDAEKSGGLDKGKGKEEEPTFPAAGYTILLGLQADRRPTIIRRTDGFEKRILYRCGRCRLVVGYEIASSAGAGEEMDVDGVEGEIYKGKLLYLLPGGVMSTDVMAKEGVRDGGNRIGEGDVGVEAKSVGVFE